MYVNFFWLLLIHWNIQIHPLSFPFLFFLLTFCLFFLPYVKVLSSVQSLSHVRLCDPRDCSTPALPVHHPGTYSQSLLKLKSIELVMPSNHLILCHPLLLMPSIFPESESFQMSQFFSSGGQNIGVSASTSVLPINTQDWSPLGWISWIFLQSKGLLRVFSNTTVQKHQFFGAQLSSQSNSHIHTWLLEKP